MARASEHMDDWHRMLELLRKDSLNNDEELELQELQLFFRGKSNRGEKNKAIKSKAIFLIDPNGKATLYESRKELMYQASISSSALYDAILRNNGYLKPNKWSGYRVKEMK